MLPSAAAIPPQFFAPDVAALLGTIAAIAIVPVLVALGVLLFGIVTEDRVVRAVRQRPVPLPGPALRRVPPTRTAA